MECRPVSKLLVPGKLRRRVAAAAGAIALLGTAAPLIAQDGRPQTDENGCYRDPQGKLVRDVVENGQRVVRGCRAGVARAAENGGGGAAGGGGISGLAIGGGAIVLGGLGIALAAQGRSGG